MWRRLIDSVLSKTGLSKLDHPTEDQMFPRKHVDTVIFVVIVGLFITFRLWHLNYFSLDGDEIFSVQAARQDLFSISSFIVRDLVHPPLFYLLLKIWISIVGESLLWLRLLPAITAVASLFPFFLLCRELNCHIRERNVACCYSPSTVIWFITHSTCGCTVCCFF